MRKRHVSSPKEAGFTLIEVLIAVIVAALFISAFGQMYIIQSRLSSEMDTYELADELAYSNLRTYAFGKSPTWFTCTYASGSPVPVELIDSDDPVEGLPGPVSQSVVATAPYGCGGSSGAIGYPIKVVSTVTYDTDGRTVVHATYTTY